MCEIFDLEGAVLRFGWDNLFNELVSLVVLYFIWVLLTN